MLGVRDEVGEGLGAERQVRLVRVLGIADGDARRGAGGSRLVRSYLVREVLEEFEPEIREFLRRTCALGVLTADSCDARPECGPVLRRSRRG